MYECNVCQKIYENKNSFLGHCSSHKRIKSVRVKPTKRHLCKYCSKEFQTGIALGGHTVNCILNPNQVTVSHKGYKHSSETKSFLSKKRAEQLEELGTGGFSFIKHFKIKNINSEEFCIRGTWELKVAEWFNENKILWVRKKYLNYKKDGVNKTYVPDFYLPNENVYFEVKGYFSDIDKEKIKLVEEQNNIKIHLLFDKEIKKLSEVIPSCLYHVGRVSGTGEFEPHTSDTSPDT